MGRLKLIIVLGFSIMFVAGLAIGRSHRNVNATPLLKGQDHFPHIREELGLNPSQEQQMKKIWDDTRGHIDSLTPQFRELDRQRDESLLALLTPEQQAAYKKISEDHASRSQAVRSEIQSAIRDAESQTRGILSAEQQKKYDDMIKQHGHRRPPGDFMGGPPSLGSSRHHGHWGTPSSLPTVPVTVPAPPQSQPSS